MELFPFLVFSVLQDKSLISLRYPRLVWLALADPTLTLSLTDRPLPLLFLLHHFLSKHFESLRLVFLPIVTLFNKQSSFRSLQVCRALSAHSQPAQATIQTLLHNTVGPKIHSTKLRVCKGLDFGPRRLQIACA